MTAKTTQELIYRAMTELGRLYSGEAPSDADYDTVNALVEPLVEQLNAEEIAYIDDIDAIDPKWFLPLARLLAIEASGSFGNDAIGTLISRNRAANVDALRDREHATLRRINATRGTGEVLKATYY